MRFALLGLLPYLIQACSIYQPLDAVFVMGHKKTGAEDAFASQSRWLVDSANYLGIGVLNRDTQVGLVTDESNGVELTCITTDIGVLKWQLSKQQATTANGNATAKAINLAAMLLPTEARGSADQVQTAMCLSPPPVADVPDSSTVLFLLSLIRCTLRGMCLCGSLSLLWWIPLCQATTWSRRGWRSTTSALLEASR